MQPVDDDVRAAMKSPTWDVPVPPDAAERIRRTVIRRRRERRGLIAAAVAVLVVAVPTAVELASRGSGVVTPAPQPSAIDGCPPPVETDELAAPDWYDFINLEGRYYERLRPDPGDIFPYLGFGPGVPAPGTLGADELGQRVGVVCYKLSDLALPRDYHHRPGDAGYLPAGTELRVLDGYAPWFRIGAIVRGGLAVYELVDRPDARTGADLFDIRGKVRQIAFQLRDGEPLTITDPRDVRDVVEAVLAAPLYPPEHRIPEDDYGAEVRLRFLLEDGTIMQRSYFPDADLVDPRLLEPRELQQAFEEATAGR